MGVMKRGTPQHPKMEALADRFSIPLFSAVGLMELLWHWTAQFAPQGDIGRWDNRAIAKGVSWPIEDADRLIESVRYAKWIDAHDSARFVIHDWFEHAEDSVHIYLARKGLLFIGGQ